MPASRTPRILVLEDELFIAMTTQDTLEAGGYEVVGPCSTVEGALELLSCEALDAAVLDVNIRNETSYDVAEKLDELGIPWCVTTGYAPGDLGPSFERALILVKPVLSEELLETVASLVGRRDRSPPAQ